jgi:hypothetical protein
VTPTYYVYFTSTTIITSAILFRGFKGTPTSIVTCVLGFLTICAGVVLLQLSKSAKDVPDAALFKGDLNQIQEIAEQEEPETEPRADAIRGAAAIVRRFSTARQARELEEVRRLQEGRMQEQLEAASQGAPTLYEWDGIRRRRTTMGSTYSRHSGFVPGTGVPRSPHPPSGLGAAARFASDEELDRHGAASPSSAIFSGLSGSMRRARAQTYADGHEKLASPVPLTRVSGAPNEPYDEEMAYQGAGGGDARRHLGLPTGLRPPRSYGDVGSSARPSHSAPGDAGAAPSTPTGTRRNFSFHNVFKWHGSGGGAGDRPVSGSGSMTAAPRSPLGIPRQTAQGTEEERLGLVKGDSRSLTHAPREPGMTLEEESEDSLDYRSEEEKKSPMLVPATALNEAAARGLDLSSPSSSEPPTPPRAHKGSPPRTPGQRPLRGQQSTPQTYRQQQQEQEQQQPSPPRVPAQAQRQRGRGRSNADEHQDELEHYQARRARWNESQSRPRGEGNNSRPGTSRG